MSFETVKKIIDEVASKEFSEKHAIKRIELSENGDCFCNPDIIEILRYIKQKIPNIDKQIFTNFALFTKDKIKIVLKENLINTVYCNIDSLDSKQFFMIKRLKSVPVMQNFLDFIKLRKQLNKQIPLKIGVISLQKYIYCIKEAFGFYPSKLEVTESILKVKDDFERTQKKVSQFLEPGDEIQRWKVFGWAERNKIQKKEHLLEKIPCPRIIRLHKEAFIAPDGTWYACCVDSNNELVLGNIKANSIQEIFESK